MWAHVDDLSDERRDRLHAFLQEQGPPPDVRAGSLLTGWAIVTTWIDPSGERSITKAHAAEIPHWTAQGMHHEALYGDWPEDGE